MYLGYFQKELSLNSNLIQKKKEFDTVLFIALFLLVALNLDKYLNTTFNQYIINYQFQFCVQQYLYHQPLCYSLHY